MLVNIESSELCLVRNTKSKSSIDRFENDVHRDCSETKTRDNTQKLDSELAEATTVEQSARRGAERYLAEQADRDRPPDPT